MKHVGDIMFPTGKYQREGVEKTSWAKCGVLLQNDKGDFRIKMDLVPLNSGDGWFAVFEKREPRPAQQGQPKQQEGMDW